MAKQKMNQKKIRTTTSLRGTLTLFFVGLSTTILFVAISLGAILNYPSIHESVEDSLNYTAYSVESDLEDFFHERFQILKVSSQFQYTHADEHAEAEENFPIERFLGIDPSFRRVVFFDVDGNLMNDVSRLPQSTLETFHITDPTSIVLEMLQTKEEYISEAFLDEVTGEPIVIIGILVYDILGDYRGTIFAEINLKFLWEAIAEVPVRETGVAYAVDETGRLVAFHDTSRVLQREDVTYIESVGKWLADGTEGKLLGGKGITGTRAVNLLVPVPSANWGLVVELPYAEAYEVLWSMLVIFSVVLLIGLATGFITSVMLARHITSPLLKLRDFVQKLDKGNLEERISLDVHNEIGEVAQAFNNMADNLQHSYQMLEGKVAERTADLDTKVSELEKLNEFMVNRELKMIELKNEVKRLKEKSGKD